MALSHLIKYVYNTGSDEVIRRGKKIHASGYVELAEHDDLMNAAVFRVKDDTYSTYYRVNVQHYNDPKSLSVRCSCPYNLGDICRHEAAALLQLQELIDKNMLGGGNIRYNQLHTIAKMKHIDLKVIRVLSSPDMYDDAEKIALAGGVDIISAVNERVEGTVKAEEESWQVVVQKNDERNFDTSCKCHEEGHPLCVHKTALLLHLFHKNGPYYFDTIRNWDKEKNKLLQIYGYSLDDDLTGKFEFAYKDGKPFLKVLDTTIKRVAPTTPIAKPSYMQGTPAVPKEMPEVAVAEEPSPAKRLGVVFNFNTNTYPYFLIDAVQGDYNNDTKKLVGKTEKLDLTKYVNTEPFSEDDKMLLQQVRKLQASEINKYLNRNSPFSGIWENIIHTDGDDLPEETKVVDGGIPASETKKII